MGKPIEKATLKNIKWLIISHCKYQFVDWLAYSRQYAFSAYSIPSLHTFFEISNMLAKIWYETAWKIYCSYELHCFPDLSYKILALGYENCFPDYWVANHPYWYLFFVFFKKSHGKDWYCWKRPPRQMGTESCCRSYSNQVCFIRLVMLCLKVTEWLWKYGTNWFRV